MVALEGPFREDLKRITKVALDWFEERVGYKYAEVVWVEGTSAKGPKWQG
jgi:hypothetical protein